MDFSSQKEEENLWICFFPSGMNNTESTCFYLLFLFSNLTHIQMAKPEAEQFGGGSNSSETIT